MPGSTHIKVRVQCAKRGGMSKRDFLRAIIDTIETGVVQPGIEIAYIDWARAKTATGPIREGTIIGADTAKALRDFQAMITNTASSVRLGKAE